MARACRGSLTRTRLADAAYLIADNDHERGSADVITGIQAGNRLRQSGARAGRRLGQVDTREGPYGPASYHVRIENMRLTGRRTIWLHPRKASTWRCSATSRMSL